VWEKGETKYKVWGGDAISTTEREKGEGKVIGWGDFDPNGPKARRITYRSGERRRNMG